MGSPCRKKPCPYGQTGVQLPKHSTRTPQTQSPRRVVTDTLRARTISRTPAEEFGTRPANPRAYSCKKRNRARARALVQCCLFRKQDACQLPRSPLKVSLARHAERFSHGYPTRRKKTPHSRARSGSATDSLVHERQELQSFPVPEDHQLHPCGAGKAFRVNDPCVGRFALRPALLIAVRMDSDGRNGASLN
jgi:hypothetical protein